MASRVYFSPGTDCLNAILNSLEQATERIDICVFTISDNRISRKILKKYKEGIKIRLISDNDKLNDRGSDIDNLGLNGVPVKIDRTRHHMHHKFAIIDQIEVITGSYNWTRSAEKYNQENVVVTNENDIVEPYLKEFNRLWKQMEEYELK